MKLEYLLFCVAGIASAQDDIFVAADRPAALGTTGAAQCEEVHIGRSSTGPSKTVAVRPGLVCPPIVSRSNWLGMDTYPDTFTTVTSGGKVTVRRTDAPHEGWMMMLRIICCAETENPLDEEAAKRLTDLWAHLDYDYDKAQEKMKWVNGHTTAEEPKEMSDSLAKEATKKARKPIGSIGPAWTYGQGEKPAGEKDMGGWTMAVYTEEQQQRLGVDETGAAHVFELSEHEQKPKNKVSEAFKTAAAETALVRATVKRVERQSKEWLNKHPGMEKSLEKVAGKTQHALKAWFDKKMKKAKLSSELKAAASKLENDIANSVGNFAEQNI